MGWSVLEDGTVYDVGAKSPSSALELFTVDYHGMDDSAKPGDRVFMPFIRSSVFGSGGARLITTGEPFSGELQPPDGRDERRPDDVDVWEREQLPVPPSQLADRSVLLD